MNAQPYTCWIENQKPIRLYDYYPKTAAEKFAELHWRHNPVRSIQEKLTVHVTNSQGHHQTFHVKSSVRISYVAEESDD